MSCSIPMQNSSVKHQVRTSDQSKAVHIDYSMCVGCQLCVKACNEQQKIGALGLAPLKTPPYPQSVTGKNEENTETTRVRLDDTCCIGCGQCITMCNSGAIKPTNLTVKIDQAKNQGQVMVAVTAPSTRIGVAEAMGMPIGQSAEGQMVQGLRRLGFEYVFDNLWGADATTIEDAKEVIKARQAGKGTIFTSCCPGWINLVETRYPELIPQLSTARSPNGIICSCIKKFWAKELGKRPEDIFVASFFPCTAKKFEVDRPQLTTDTVKDCDLAVSSRELAQLFKDAGIAFSEDKEQIARSTKEGKFDLPFNEYSGSAYLFGKTGGVAESVIRYVFALNKLDFSGASYKQYDLWESKDEQQQIRVYEFKIQKETFKIMIVNGGSAIEQLIKIHQAGRLEGIDCVEVMACSGGCIGGGGQPKLVRKQMTVDRQKGLIKHDMESSWKACLENKPLLDMINKWMPDDQAKHDAMHTYYDNRRFEK